MFSQVILLQSTECTCTYEYILQHEDISCTYIVGRMLQMFLSCAFQSIIRTTQEFF